MADEVVIEDSQAFPERPEEPTYTALQTSQRKQILTQQIGQFEQEMAGHFSNWNRLQATFDAAPAGDEGVEVRESCREEAKKSAAAIETIKVAIQATKDERASLGG